MFCRLGHLAVSLSILAITVQASSPSLAASSTSNGLVSVPQVLELLDKAPEDRAMRNILRAYLAGVGEATGAVTRMGKASCRRSLSLSHTDAREALKSAAADKNAAETAATPLIVGDILDRAGCKRPGT